MVSMICEIAWAEQRKKSTPQARRWRESLLSLNHDGKAPFGERALSEDALRSPAVGQDLRPDRQFRWGGLLLLVLAQVEKADEFDSSRHCKQLHDDVNSAGRGDTLIGS